MRLSVLYLLSIDEYLEIDGDPVRFLAPVLTVHIPVPEELIVEYVRTQFLTYLLPERVLNRIVKFDCPASPIPSPVFVTAVLASLLKKVTAHTVMAEVCNSYADAVDTLPHM